MLRACPRPEPPCLSVSHSGPAARPIITFACFPTFSRGALALSDTHPPVQHARNSAGKHHDPHLQAGILSPSECLIGSCGSFQRWMSEPALGAGIRSDSSHDGGQKCLFREECPCCGGLEGEGGRGESMTALKTLPQGLVVLGLDAVQTPACFQEVALNTHKKCRFL